jgi:hypothetical protein
MERMQTETPKSWTMKVICNNNNKNMMITATTTRMMMITATTIPTIQ